MTWREKVFLRRRDLIEGEDCALAGLGDEDLRNLKEAKRLTPIYLKKDKCEGKQRAYYASSEVIELRKEMGIE